MRENSNESGGNRRDQNKKLDQFFDQYFNFPYKKIKIDIKRNKIDKIKTYKTICKYGQST